MLYKVQLNNDSVARVDQIIKIGLIHYLSVYGRVGMYTKGEAQKKAKAFKGTIEAVESSKLIEDMTIATYPIEALKPNVLSCLEYRHAFNDADETLGENIYSTETIFEIYAEKVEEMKREKHCVLTDGDIYQLMELASMFVGYEYVLITKV